MIRYGFPYMGSKNQIAEWIVDLLPKATNFYDLFCGGCAVTHCAITKNKYENYFINDINPLAPQLFLDAINGKYKNEDRWISRDDFKKLKDVDGYVKYCWSFGNRGGKYLYGKEIEPYKKAAHYAILFKDTSLIDELLGVSYFEEIKRIEGLSKRYSFYKERMKELLIERNKRELRGLKGLQRVQSLERLQRVQSLEGLENINSFLCDYQNVNIEQNSVIYCDIPYKGTEKYDIVNSFDYGRFYSWAEKQNNIFISEYWMPEDRFKCIAEKEKRSIFSSTNNSSIKIEKVFIPIKNEYNTDTKYKQLTLF